MNLPLIEKDKQVLLHLKQDKEALIKGVNALTHQDIYANSQRAQALELLMADISKNVSMKHLLQNKTVSMGAFVANCGENIVSKVIILCLRRFCDSIMVARKMQMIDYVEVVNIFLEKHQHESIDDILVALKEAKASGRKDYGGFGSQDVFAIFNDHLERKIIARENEHLQKKQGFDNVLAYFSTNTDAIEVLKTPKQTQTIENQDAFTLTDELNELNDVLYSIDTEDLKKDLMRSFWMDAYERFCLILNELDGRKFIKSPQRLQIIDNNYLLTEYAKEEITAFKKDKALLEKIMS